MQTGQSEATGGGTIALTGASGLLGGALARRLREDGVPLRLLLRKPHAEWQSGPGIEVIIGELDDGDALDRLVEGVDAVVHVAAMYRNDGPREDFLKANTEGTCNLLAAAQRARVRRFVYCSTIGVHGSVEHSPSDEEAPFAPRDNYQESKLLAEQACRAAVGQTPTEIVILRPCGIYGPGDTRMLKMFRMLNKGRFVLVGKCEANFHPVYIDDLVDGFVRAVRAPGIDGEAFILGGPEYLPLGDYVGVAAAALGVPGPRIRIPYRLMETAARLCESVSGAIGVEPPLHRRRLTFFKHNRAFSIEKARKRLGYDPQVGLEEGFRRTVAWYRQQGLLA